VVNQPGSDPQCVHSGDVMPWNGNNNGQCADPSGGPTVSQ
jgi:hypothetical protein